MKKNGHPKSSKLKLLDAIRHEAGEGICPHCAQSNEELAKCNRALIRMINIQASSIESLVNEIESLSEELKCYAKAE